MFIYILSLFCTENNTGVDFENFETSKRSITLNMNGYCFSDIKEIFLKENKKRIDLKKKFKVENPGDLITFGVPDEVKSTFSVIIITSTFSIIKIGRFEFHNKNSITQKPSKPLKIFCKHHSHKSDYEKTKDKFLKGREKKMLSLDNYPVVRYMLRANDLYLDLKMILKNTDDLTEIRLQNNDNSHPLDLKLDKQNYEFNENADMTKFYPATTFDTKPYFVLRIKDLNALTNVDDFFISLKINDETFYIERFGKEDGGGVRYKSIADKVYMFKEISKDAHIDEKIPKDRARLRK